jgi:hypothetical protein
VKLCPPPRVPNGMGQSPNKRHYPT